MKKRFYAAACAVSLLLSGANAFADDPSWYYIYSHTAGICEYSVALQNGALDKTIFLPFDSDSLKISYGVSADTSVTVAINGEKYTVKLSADKTEAIIEAKTCWRMGDCTVTLDGTGITELVFRKAEKQSVGRNEEASNGSRPVTKYTDYEAATMTAVILNMKSLIYKCRGARRYINYDEMTEAPLAERDSTYIPLKTLAKKLGISESAGRNYLSYDNFRYVSYSEISDTPVSESGNTYLPVKTAARALGLYSEEDKPSGYACIGNDNFEYVLKDDVCYYRDNAGSYTEVENIFKTSGGIYAPFEVLAEKIGMTVYKTGDYVIADYYGRVEEIKEKYLDEIKAEFTEYIPSGKTGNVYHVAQKAENASDENDGSESAPWRSLEKAGAEAKAGDTVIIHSGVYRETLTAKNDGTASEPITFTAADGEDVTISALDRVTAAAVTDGDLLKYETGIYLGDGRNQVFCGGEALAEARHPNTDTAQRRHNDEMNLNELWPTQGNIQVVSDSSAVSGTDLEQERDFWKGGTLVTFNGSAFSTATAKITGSKSGELTLGEHSKELWNSKSVSGDYAYITGTKNAIDVPGEWYIDENGTLYIYPPEGENEQSLELEVKARQATVNLSGRSYVNITGINTVGGGMILKDTEMCVINGGEHKYVGHFTYTMDPHHGYVDYDFSRWGNVYSKYAEDGAPQKGEQGIYIDGSDDAVVNAKIRYSAGSGIYLSGKYTYIDNNLIEDCGYTGTYVGGIYISETGAKHGDNTDLIVEQRGGYGIYNNTVCRTGRAALTLQSPQGCFWDCAGLEPYIANEIAYNDFYDASITARDTGVIYTYGPRQGDDIKKSTYHHNHIWNSQCSDGTNMGIYFDNYSQDAAVYGNITFYTDEDIAYTHGGVYVQSNGNFSDTFATVDDWNNTNLGYVPGGKASLKKEDYPNQRIFLSGYSPDCSKAAKEFTAEAYEYSAANAVLLQGAKYSDGLAVLENGDGIEFKNVRLGSNNALRLGYCGDKYDENCAIEIAVGSSYAEAKKIGASLIMTADRVNQADSTVIAIPTGGDDITNIYITKKAGNTPIGIYSICPTRDDKIFTNGNVDGKTYFGNYEKIIKNRAPAVGRKYYAEVSDAKSRMVNMTFPGVVLYYKNVYIADTANYFAVMAGTDETYSGGKYYVRLSSQDAEASGYVTVNKNSWTDFTPSVAKLNKPISPGVYDIYITMGETGKLTTADSVWFGFLNNIGYDAQIEAGEDGISVTTAAEDNLGIWRAIAVYDSDECSLIDLLLQGGSDKNGKSVLEYPEASGRYKVKIMMFGNMTELNPLGYPIEKYIDVN